MTNDRSEMTMTTFAVESNSLKQEVPRINCKPSSE